LIWTIKLPCYGRQLVGEAGTSGDPIWIGPWPELRQSCPSDHIFEPAASETIPGDIYAEKVGNLEVLHDVDQVVSATAEVRASLRATA